jgi:acetyl esterase/lipase
MARLTRRGFVKATGAVAATPAIAAVSTQARAQTSEDIRVDADIVFGKAGDMELLLDVYHPPAGQAKRMAIVHLFGGGFFTGSRRGVAAASRAFASVGYTSIASTYRLQNEGKWPAQLEDVKAAVRWARANAADIGIDSDKIAVAGYSAGGALALLAAGTNGRAQFEGMGGNAAVSSDVQAAIGFYPATGGTAGLFDGQPTAEQLAAAQAGTYIGPDFAPTILIHGTKDGTIPYSSSVNFFHQLQEAGVPSALHLIQGADHAFDNGAPDALLVAAQSADLFLDRLIVNPTPYPSFGFGGGGGRGRGGAGRGGPGGPGAGGGFRGRGGAPVGADQN